MLTNVNLEAEPGSEIAETAKYMILSAHGLIGETFEEEGRSLTAVYDSVLKLVGSGIWKGKNRGHTFLDRFD